MKQQCVVAITAAIIGLVGNAKAAAKNEISDIGRDLAVVRQSTAHYHRVEVAEAEGYAPYPVARCNPGGGVFFLNFDLLLDGVLDLEHPDALSYMPMPNGQLQLVAVFFFRVAEWDAEADDWEPAPVFLGHEMELNIGPIPVWEMKIWVWANNPDGLFEYLNPRLMDHCRYFEAP